jgi:hypothetical protein
MPRPLLSFTSYSHEGPELSARGLMCAPPTTRDQGMARGRRGAVKFGARAPYLGRLLNEHQFTNLQHIRANSQTGKVRTRSNLLAIGIASVPGVDVLLAALQTSVEQ